MKIITDKIDTPHVLLGLFIFFFFSGALLQKMTQNIGWTMIPAAGFALIGLILLFRLVFRSNKWALIVFFTASSTQAVFFFLGLSRGVPVFITEFCAGVLFLKSLLSGYHNSQHFHSLVGRWPTIFIGCCMLISYALSRPDPLAAILCVRQTFIFFFFFFALQQLDITDNTIIAVNRYIVLLLLIQLPVGLTKLIIEGQNEFWIGTISAYTGSLSTTFPLLIICFLTAFFFHTRRPGYIVLVLCYFLFGIIGEKRAIVYYLPIVLIGVYVFYIIQNKKLTLRLAFKSILTMTLIIAVSFMALFFSAKMIRTMNPDIKRWGNFDIHYLIFNRLIGYNFRNLEPENDPNEKDVTILTDSEGKLHVLEAGSSMGRFKITMVVIEKMLKDGIVHLLFGYGPGTMIRSPHIGRSKETPYKKFGIYGTYTGFVVYVLQIGFLGVICLSAFMIQIGRTICRRIGTRSTQASRMLATGFLGAILLFFIDFFSYSQTTFNQHAVFPLYLYTAVLLIREFPVQSLMEMPRLHHFAPMFR